MLVNDNLVKIRGKISMTEDRPTPKIEVQSVTLWGLEDVEIVEDTRKLCIRLTSNDDEIYQKVRSLIQRYDDSHGASVKIQIEKSLYTLPNRVANVEGLKNRLVGIVGYNNVKILD